MEFVSSFKGCSMRAPKHHIHMFVKRPVCDLFPICCYNSLHFSGKAFYTSISATTTAVLMLVRTSRVHSVFQFILKVFSGVKGHD